MLCKGLWKGGGGSAKVGNKNGGKTTRYMYLLLTLVLTAALSHLQYKVNQKHVLSLFLTVSRVLFLFSGHIMILPIPILLDLNQFSAAYTDFLI